MSIPFVSYVAFYSHLGPIAAGLNTMKRLSRPMQMLLALLTTFFILYLVALYYSINRRNNLELENYGEILETVGICGIYIVAMKVKAMRLLSSLLLGVYGVVAATIMVSFHTPNQIDVLATTLGKVTMLISGIVYLYYALKYDTQPLTRDPVFWVAVGNLLFNAGTIIIYALANRELVMGSEHGPSIWMIAHVLVIVSNGFYMKGFLCSMKMPPIGTRAVVIALVFCFAPLQGAGQSRSYSREESIRYHQLNIAWAAAGTYQSKPYYLAVLDTIDTFLRQYPASIYNTGIYSYKMDLVSCVSSDAHVLGEIADSLLRYDPSPQTKLGIADIFMRKKVNAARGTKLLHEILPQLTVKAQRYQVFTLLATYDMAHGNDAAARDELQLAILLDSTRYEAWYSALALAKARENIGEARAIEARLEALDKKELLHFAEYPAKSVNLFKDLSSYMFTDMQGRSVTPASFRNTILILDFFAFWCGACFPELPMSFRKLAKEFPGARFVYVNVSGKDIGSTPSVIREKLLNQPKFRFLKTQTLLFPPNYIGDSLSIKGVPTTMILDGHGVVRFEYVGYTKGSEEVVRRNIRQLLDEMKSSGTQ